MLLLEGPCFRRHCRKSRWPALEESYLDDLGQQCPTTCKYQPLMFLLGLFGCNLVSPHWISPILAVAWNCTSRCEVALGSSAGDAILYWLTVVYLKKQCLWVSFYVSKLCFVCLLFWWCWELSTGLLTLTYISSCCCCFCILLPFWHKSLMG